MPRLPFVTFLTLIVLVGALVSGCASTSKMAAPTPAGAWDYVIANTPQGDATGVLMITTDMANYAGEMSSDMLNQSVPIQDVAFQDSTFMFKAVFDADGQVIDTMTRMTLRGNSMQGMMEVAGFGEFEVTATRKMTDSEM